MKRKFCFPSRRIWLTVFAQGGIAVTESMNETPDKHGAAQPQPKDSHCRGERVGSVPEAHASGMPVSDTGHARCVRSQGFGGVDEESTFCEKTDAAAHAGGAGERRAHAEAHAGSDPSDRAG